MDERVPDHSTISQNRRRRFRGEALFHRLFERILEQCIENGLVEGALILTDSTHVKANASFKKNVQVMAERESTSYMERLDVYEARERAQLESSGAIKPQCAKRTPKEKSKALFRLSSPRGCQVCQNSLPLDPKSMRT